MPGHILDENTTALWRTNEVVNAIPDLATWQQASGVSKQVVFDAVDDLISMGNNHQFERTSPFSVSIWFATTATGTSQGLISATEVTANARGWTVVIRSSNVIGFILCNDNNLGTNSCAIDTTGTFNDGKPHNVVMTYDGSSNPSGMLAYVDGVAVAKTTVFNTLTLTTVGTGVTRISGPGLREHASIWNKALSPSEVAEVFGSGAPPNLLVTSMVANLVGWWRVNGSDSLTTTGGIIDYSGQAHPGTVTGGLAFYAPTLTRSPVIVNAMPGIAGGPRQHNAESESIQDNCRWFSTLHGQIKGLTSPASTAAVAAFLGKGWTVEAWIYLDRTDALDQVIISYSAVGESLATNFLCRMQVNAAGNLGVLWEFPPFANFSADSIGLIPKQQWVHVAMTGLENGVNRDVEFFIAGVSSGTASGTKAGGGTSSAWFVGISESAVNNIFGGIAYARVSRVVRTPVEIAAAATNPLTITNDNDTVAFWGFQEAPQIRDYAKHGIHMAERTLIDGIAPSGQDLWGIVGPNHNERAHQYLSKASNFAFQAPGPRQALTNQLAGQNPYTIETWVRPDQSSTNHLLFYCGGESGPETVADNALIGFHLISAEAVLYAVWEGGPNIYNYEARSTIPAFDIPTNQNGRFGRWYHFALRKRPTGNLDFWFFDGVNDYVVVGTPGLWRFDGVDDFISMGNVAPLQFERTDTFSLSGFFNTSTASGRIIGKAEDGGNNRGYIVFISTGGVGGATVGSVALRIANLAGAGDNQIQVETVAAYNDGIDHHFLVTYDGSNTPAGVVIYIDGIAVPVHTSFNTLTGTILNADNFTISDVNAFNGVLHDLAVWNAVLTAPQAVEIYGAGVAPNLLAVSASASLAGWWKLNTLDSGIINGVIDYGPNNLHGTASGGIPGYNTPQLNFERTSPFTLVVWIQSNVSGVAHLVGKTESDVSPAGYQFSINAAGQLVFRLENAAGQRVEKRVTTASVVSGGGTTRCCVVTYSGSSNATGVNIYTAGELQLMTTVTNTLASGSTLNTKPFTIGRRDEVDQPYGGYIHEVSVFDRVLTLAEVIEANGGGTGTGRARPNLLTSSMAADLVGWWKFDQTDAAVAGSIYWDFNGTTSVISMGDVLDFERTDAFTLSGWTDVVEDGTRHLIAKIGSTTAQQGYTLRLTTGNIFQFTLDNNVSGGVNAITVNSVNTLPPGHYHLAATYDGSSTAAGVRLFVNGISVPTTVVNDTLTLTTITATAFTLGNRAAADLADAGQLQHCSVWNNNLTDAEILEVYGGGTPPNLLATSMAADLVGWWRLDATDTNGPSGVIDQSVNNNHGTPTNVVRAARYTIADHSVFNSDGTTRGGLEPSLLACAAYDLFSNGEKIDTIPGIPDAQTSDIYLATGSSYLQSIHDNAVPEARWDTRISDIARSDAEILQSYLDGVQTGGSLNYKMRAVDSGRPDPGYIYWVADFPDFDATLVGTSIPTLIGTVVAGSVTEISSWEV